MTVDRFYVGGLFIRMPWHKGIAGEVINAAGQRNNQAEQRAIWTDVGMAIAGRDDWDTSPSSITRTTRAFRLPGAWILSWVWAVAPDPPELARLTEGESEVTRHRLIVYTGQLDPTVLHRAWTRVRG